ncbi:MAG: sigma 54-interacting transcriptional regulator, partial [Sinobacteraceae bacterium]|nr:sigma 54-interacting transcriptional regulator [Nevskiaceae bacterium]
ERIRREQLIAAAGSEMDRLFERISDSGCALLLTDESGTILRETTNAALKGTFQVTRVNSVVGSVPIGASVSKDPLVAPTGNPLVSNTPAVNSVSGHTSGSSAPRAAGAEREVALAAFRAAQHALTLEDLAGEDAQMLRNVRSAYRIADSGVSVLIQGPTGSGKEAFAHAMHLVSRRADRPFVAVNCAAIPETLIESELFGYKPGAFTGARKEGMRGKILQSAGGTLFLDEIGDMPLALQTRLLRVLEEQEIVPLGSESAIKVDLHVLAASHRNLREMIANGTFREDLYYRLNGITLELPALRDRADKERVIHHALAAETGNGRPAAIEMDALQRLLAYPWPGNIRELRNVIRTALAICEGGVVRGIDLPREIRDAHVDAADRGMGTLLSAEAGAGAQVGANPANPLRAAERAALVRVIAECHGNMTRVASQLGMSRNTLYRRMKRHAIPLAHGSTPAA